MISGLYLLDATTWLAAGLLIGGAAGRGLRAIRDRYRRQL